MAAPRRVWVDDNDPDIHYIGPWFADQGGQDNVGNFGPPFKNSMHGTKSSASLSYTFNGTDVQIIGSMQIANNSGVIDPTWECFVDKISIGAAKPFQFAENNWGLCDTKGLSDGPHTITVNASVNSRTFWFDSIRYRPSPSVDLANKSIFVDHSDPELKYGNGWGMLGGSANMTGRTDAEFKYTFNGVSLAWYGFIPSELPGASAQGTFTVDDNDPVIFTLRGHGANSPTHYNQKFFETATYPQGEHNLTVIYKGTGSTTPLVLEYLVIQNGTAEVPPTDTSSGSKTNVGAIAGGVVGGVVALLLLGVLAFFFIRRRRDGASSSGSEKGVTRDDETRVEPYSQPPSTSNGPSYLPVSNGQHIRNESLGTGSYYPEGYLGGGASSSALSGSGSGGTQGHGVTSPPLPLGAGAPAVYGAHLGTPTSSKLQREAQREREAREAEAMRAYGGIAPVVMSPPSDLSSGSGRIVMHEDSGIRIPSSRHEPIVEVPPQYTPG